MAAGEARARARALRPFERMGEDTAVVSMQQEVTRGRREIEAETWTNIENIEGRKPFGHYCLPLVSPYRAVPALGW